MDRERERTGEDAARQQREVDPGKGEDRREREAERKRQPIN
jgi:hypothetical protein